MPSPRVTPVATPKWDDGEGIDALELEQAPAPAQAPAPVGGERYAIPPTAPDSTSEAKSDRRPSVSSVSFFSETLDKMQSFSETLDKMQTALQKRVIYGKKAYTYDMAPGAVMLQWKGTFWPHVVHRYEIYVFPGIHLALVILAHWWWDEEAEGRPMWGDELNMVPWEVITMFTTLSVFFLVFFLSQCYTRFQNYFAYCQSIEAAVHELIMVLLSRTDDAESRWNAVRYLTASAIVIYTRCAAISRGQDAQMDLNGWRRLLMDEKTFTQLGDEPWEKVMGWPRTREQAATYTAELHKELGLGDTTPERQAFCPALLTKSEVDELRRYPGGLMSYVLQTWTVQTICAQRGDTGEAILSGPMAAMAQGAVFKMRAAAYGLRRQLSMPVPLPYFHALTVLQHLNFSAYTWAMLQFDSYLTPLFLMVFCVITVGMREVGVALSNPFGDDEVDFPVDEWIAQLRGMALTVYPANHVIKLPKKQEVEAHVRNPTLKRAASAAFGAVAFGSPPAGPEGATPAGRARAPQRTASLILNEVLKRLREEEHADDHIADAMDSHSAGTGTSSNGAFMFAEAS